MVPGPEFQWDTRELSDYLSYLSLFLEKLLVLIHVTGGQPVRAPELLSLRYSNSTKTGTRNVFVENGLLVFVTSYHKGYLITGTTKIIYQYLPREVGELLVYYLWLVVPFLERILLTKFRKTLSEYLFENFIKKKGSKASRNKGDQFRRVFRRETLAGLGVAINPAECRHIAIGISRRFLAKSLQFQPEESIEIDEENDLDIKDDVIDLQAGYSSSTAGIIYARGLFETKGEVQGLNECFREASIVILLFLTILNINRPSEVYNI